ncbi:MAG: carbohydrate kinase family protein [Bacilli bacterium]|nr:carbohydrate kinase family protein [Bacilli bacterium]
MKILCIGNAAYDVTLPLKSFPEENKKVRLDYPKVECGGGSASNCAYLLAKWGLEVYFAGVVGDDYYGQMIEKEFKSIGVNTKYLEVNKDVVTTSSYIINNTSKGTRTILTNKGNNTFMTKLDIEDEDFDIILFDGYEYEFAKEAIKKNPNAIKIIDAGSLRENTVDLAKKCNYVVCSKDFAEDFTKEKVDYRNVRTLMKIYDDLKKAFTGEIIITLEDHGCFTYSDGYKLIPSIEVENQDSTGAGDIYHGAFTYCIASGYDLLTTMKISNIAGALSVTRIGGRYSIFELDEVMTKYKELDAK